MPSASASGIAVEAEHSTGAGTDELADAVESAVRDVVDARRHAALEQLDQALGRSDGLAVHGLEPVLAALRAAAASDAAFVPLGGGRSGFVGRPVDDGVAAVLRFPLPPGA